MMTAIKPASVVAETDFAAGRSSARANPDWHDGFMQLLPDIRRHARFLLWRCRPRRCDEAVDDVIALALVGYVRLMELGKQDLAYAVPLTRFSVAQYRAGRRVGLRTNVRDVLSPVCRRRNRLNVERLDQFDRTTGSWQEVLVEDKRFTPADAAASRIDFRAWLTTLTPRNRQVAEKLAVGESTSTVARLFGLSRGRVSQLRRELHAAWRLFQSEPLSATA